MMKDWLQAFRLRTLPLALASVIMGSMLAGIYAEADIVLTLLCLLCAILLQILSNLANDYGDFEKGTDNDARIGNQRALQSGRIKPQQMKKMILLFVALTLLCGITLLRTAFQHFSFISWAFFLAGLAAIAAAIKYTMGKNPYGYSGKGDIAVFIFFGLFAVLGTAYVQAHEFRWAMLLPACSMGLLATAVLNVNNIRDIDNDKAHGKITIPVKLGAVQAKRYHLFLVTTALICALAFALLQYSHIIGLIFLPALLPIVQNTRQVIKTEPSAAYNKFLKQLSLSILLFVLLYAASFALSYIFVIAGILEHVTR